MKQYSSKNVCLTHVPELTNIIFKGYLSHTDIRNKKKTNKTKNEVCY